MEIPACKSFLEKYRDREIVVYCAGGNRSLHGAHFLLQKGFNAVNLRGGMSAWRALKAERIKFSMHADRFCKQYATSDFQSL